METVQYLRALGRSWFIVLITLVAGGAGGYLVYHRETPMYQSSARMIVSGNAGGKGQDEVSARILATQRAGALAQIASTPPAIKAAAKAAGYPAALPSVASSSSTDGPFLTVTVTDADPRRAQAIANSFAATLPTTLTRLEGRSDTPISVANLEAANLPAEPVSPKLVNDLGLGIAAGLILGIAIALLREGVDRTIRDSGELEQFTGLVALGTVPRGLAKQPLPVTSSPRSPRAEGYRQIRTTLLNAEDAPRTIAVTSASAGEGKTSVAANLAAVFSRAGHRVVLVDADMRRPRVATTFDVPARPGLSDVLSRRVSLEDALQHVDNGRLTILTSGTIPTNPSEALGAALMEEIVERLAEDYEYVFVDTPPVLPVTDALVVAPMVDAVILVTRLGRTTRERVGRAQASIRRVNANVIGVVPNYAGVRGADRDYSAGYKYAGSHQKGDAPTEVDVDHLQQHEGAGVMDSLLGGRDNASRADQPPRRRHRADPDDDTFERPIPLPPRSGRRSTDAPTTPPSDRSRRQSR